MIGRCICGGVTVITSSKPEYINDCDCSLCAKLGAWWGYFRPSDVEVRGDTKSFVRTDRANPAVATHFCAICGASTHWHLTPAFGSDRMGVNMRLFDLRQLAGVELRFPDGASWDGQSDYGYRMPPIRL